MPEDTTPAPTVSTEAPPSAAPPNLDVTASFSDIPESYRSDPVFEGFSSSEDIFKEFKNLKMVQDARNNNGMIELIGEDSPPELVDQFYQKLGKPPTAAEYGFARPENLPEGLDFSDERMAKFAELAHSQHLTKAQAGTLMEFYNNMVLEAYSQSQAQEEAQLESNMKALEAKWGGEYGSEKFNAHHKNAQKAFNYVADADMKKAFQEDPKLSSHPLVLELLSRLGSKMGPDAVTISSDTALPLNGFADSKAAVEKALKDFKESGKFQKMVTESNSESKALQAEYNALHEKLRELS